MKRTIRISESQFKLLWSQRIKEGVTFSMKHDLYKEMEEFIRAIQGAKIR